MAMQKLTEIGKPPIDEHADSRMVFMAGLVFLGDMETNSMNTMITFIILYIYINTKLYKVIVHRYMFFIDINE